MQRTMEVLIVIEGRRKPAGGWAMNAQVGEGAANLLTNEERLELLECASQRLAADVEALRSKMSANQGSTS